MSASGLQRSLPGQGSTGSGSPIKKSLQGSNKFDVKPISALELRKEMDFELKGHWVGPMPVKEFLEAFLPLPQGVKQPPKWPKRFSTLPDTIKREKELYEPLLYCINRSPKLIPKLKVVDTSDHPDTDASPGRRHKPDFSTYPTRIDTDTHKHRMDHQELPWEIKPDASWDICLDPPEPVDTTGVEVNSGGEGDEGEGEEPEEEEDEEGLADEGEKEREDDIGPDDYEEPKDETAPKGTAHLETQSTHEDEDDSDDTLEHSPEDEERLEWPFERAKKRAKESRGQLASYATSMHSRQHRLHSFSIFICYPYVRFLRYDRAGIIVSRRFDISKQGWYLIDFLWRFSRTSRSDRGWDPTVRHANVKETADVHELLKEHIPPLRRPVFAFTVPLATGEKREYFGWGAVSEADSLVGRATRAYPVADRKSRTLHFLKDSWRAECLKPEAETLELLNDKGVPYVPKLVGGGDVEDHSTQAHVFANNLDSIGTYPWALGKNYVIQRIHHRFVEDCIGQPLHRFRRSKDLLRAIYHAAQAHKAAYEDCGLLHRDISAGNILLVFNTETQEWGGILIDWDLAKDITDTNPRNHQRTGTWQFLSTLLCRYVDKLHTLQDDLESLVLVLLYHVLRYLQHSLVEDSADLITTIFSESHHSTTKKTHGGLQKELMFTRGGALRGFYLPDNEPLDWWIVDATDAVADWIDICSPPEQRRKLPRRRKQVPIPSERPDANNAFLKDHEEFLLLCKATLERIDWPVNDTAFDNCGSEATVTVSPRPQSVDSQTSSTGKRSLERTGQSMAEHQKKKKKLGGSRGN